MSWFRRWLQSLLLLIGLGMLTLGCQVLFGDFKVSDSAQGGDSGMDTGGAGSAQGGGSSAQGGGTAGNDQPSGPIIVSPTSDLYTSDLGGQARFYVSLAQRPTAGVTIPIVSTNEAEGTVSPISLSFTPDDWNAPQAITVTGVHDPKIGNQIYSVEVGPATSADKAFQKAKTTVSITNIDNDSAGYFIMPTKGLVTTEAGGRAFFTVVLNSPPKAVVTIALTSSDARIGTVAPDHLTFTADNWSAPQTVTVTGVNDQVAGGDRPYQITVGPTTSDDQAYAKLPLQTVNVSNQDNDRAGLTVALASGIDPSDTTRLRTSENGDSATFTVVLNKAPAQPVKIAVASSSSEGKSSPDSLVFTPVNWDAPQTVTVVGEDNDSVADGNQPYQVTLGPITSEDPAYGSLTTADLPYVNLVNVDNDKADFAITLLSGLDPNDASQLLTSEKGSTATFSIALTSKPKSAVHFGLTSTNEMEGKVSAGGLDFSVDNWNVAQEVTVTGQDDTTKDGNVVYAVRIAAPTTDDLAYQKLPSVDVKVVNLDDDVAGITPPKLLTNIDASGTRLFTTETGGTATFSVSLTSKPKDEVRVPVTSSTPTEGKVMPAMLIFTPANYATGQVVTVTGQNDSSVDGNQAYTVTVGPSASNDMNYVGLTQSVRVTNNDDDSAYIVPTPGYSGMTTEKGGTAVFGISLHSQPTASVTVSFVSSDMKEGRVSPASLLFTTANWATSQNITVTGIDDEIADGDRSYNISVSGGNTTDQNYMYAATTLTVTNKDDDVAQLKVTAGANLQTTEAGGQAMFTVALTSKPTGNVNVTVTSNNIKEGTALPATLPFTPDNWASAQPVTVTGVDDSIADGNQTYTVSLKAGGADPKYAQLPASTVSLVNANDGDAVGITVTPTTCDTTPTESAMFSVVLKSQPRGPVSIGLSSDTPTAGKPAPATLSFTAMNWNVAQFVTVSGLDDGSMGMMTPYKIVTAAAVSAMDSAYDGLNAADVACVNTTPMAPDPPTP